MSPQSARQQIERQARQAIIQYALFRWESALIVAGAILLSFFLPQPFPGWPIWGWAALALLAEALIIYTSLTDPETNARVVAELFRQRYNPRAVRDKKLREEIEKALAYHERVERLVQQQRGGVLRDRLADTTQQLGDWLENIFQLAHKLDVYQADAIIARDRQTVPEDIRRLQARLQQERDPSVQAQLQAALHARQAQWESLEALDNTMDRARYQLESTISALGTIYSQVQLIGAREIDSDRAQRLRADIANQVAALQDIVQTINEMYAVA
jgi:chromosome segregation ATPase